MNNNYIFKVCRVHNLIDLETVKSNTNVNMIGIHAVYYNQEEYKNSEKNTILYIVIMKILTNYQ